MERPSETTKPAPIDALLVAAIKAADELKDNLVGDWLRKLRDRGERSGGPREKAT